MLILKIFLDRVKKEAFSIKEESMKLKSVFFMMGITLCVTACAYNTDDRTAERQDRLMYKQATDGCSGFSEHEAYRNCLIKTMQEKSPKTYVTAEDSNGKPVAIIKGEKPCETTCSATKTVTTVETTTTEVVLPPKVTQTVSEPQPIVEDKTWWDEYQENKPETKIEEVKCPCEDPNDPCPQCVEK